MERILRTFENLVFHDSRLSPTPYDLDQILYLGFRAIQSPIGHRKTILDQNPGGEMSVYQQQRAICCDFWFHPPSKVSDV
jgi:hypothetical protein